MTGTLLRKQQQGSFGNHGHQHRQGSGFVRLFLLFVLPAAGLQPQKGSSGTSLFSLVCSTNQWSPHSGELQINNQRGAS